MPRSVPPWERPALAPVRRRPTARRDREQENNVPKLAQEFDIFTDASDGGSEAPKAWVCPELAALNGTIVHMHWLAKEAEGGIHD